jgi:hypothetical protein
MSDNERVQRMDADLDLISARIQGVSANVNSLSSDVEGLAQSILALVRHVRDMAEVLSPLIKGLRRTAVSGTGPGDPSRKVWVVEIPEDPEGAVGFGPMQVMIEQFGDGDPTLAFRRGGSQVVWGAPHQGVRR